MPKNRSYRPKTVVQKKLAGLTKKKKMFRKILRESRREDREARLYKCH